MYRSVATLTICCFAHLAAAAEPFKPPKITVPNGYSIELAAKPPLVKHPMMAGFDDRGRLFIAESAGKNLRRTDLEKTLPNFIRLLEDTNKDGVFDKSTIFADKMTLPMGALWYQGALYVAAPPNIWRLEDTNGDGVADKRQILVDKFGYSGNAASVHGCFLGPAGRLYWCDGRHGHEFRDKNGKVIAKGKAARIFSCKLDGSDVQVHCGGGMDNPVEIDFTDRGEMLGTVNILYRQRGDCLVHWMYGGVYPRHDQSCINEFPRTGDLLLPVHNYGHIGISGMMRYRSDYLGKSFKNNVFITEFNTHKVTRTRLTRTGSTFSAKVEDFLVAHSNDFHPTDVLEDADGSLLVVDTGGWFRIGCPTSQIAKPNILGAIYRIRPKGGKVAVDARGLRINWADRPAAISKRLGDSRFAVRARAIAELASRGNEAIPSLHSVLSTGTTTSQTNAIWTLARIDTAAARKVIRQQLALRKRKVKQVRAAAAYSVRMNKDRQATELLEKTVASRNADSTVRREAATALSIVGRPSSVTPLLIAMQSNPDRVFEHAVIHALLQIGDVKQLKHALHDKDANVARAALIALRQVPGVKLTTSDLAPVIRTNDVRLKSVVFDAIADNPSMAADVAAILKDSATQKKLSTDQATQLARLISGLAGQKPVQDSVARLLIDSRTTDPFRRVLLEGIAESQIDGLPEPWEKGIERALNSKSNSLVSQAIATIRSTGSRKFDLLLRRIGMTKHFSAKTRIAALGVALADRSPSDTEFAFLADQLDAARPALRRLAAAQTVAGSAANSTQLRTLAKLVKDAAVIELQPLLRAFESSNNEAVAKQLIQSLQASKVAFASLSQSQVERLFRNHSASIRQLARQELKVANSSSSAKQADRIAALLQLVKQSKGNVANGKRVFLSKKTSCVACHRVGKVGQNIGPDLTLIGKRRNTRDLIEAIAFPSSSFARGFESHTVVLDSGQLVSGMILRRSSDSMVVRTLDQKEVRIRQRSIANMLPNRTSIMPVGLERSMTDKELRDLISYLQSLK